MSSYYEKFADGKVVCIDEEIPFEIPQGWEWCRLGNVAEIIGGYAFPSQTIKGNVGTRVIRISDITEEGFSDTRLVRYSGGPISEIYQINQFDILIAMTGGTVGKSLFVMELPEKMLLNQRVAIIRSRHLCAGYINLVIKAPHIIAVINDRKNSTNDNISMVDIYNFLIPIPPLSEQNDIVAKYQEVRPLAERYEKAQLNADALNACLSGKLKSSILQEAIQGKLVPQDSSDEPAEKLLEKINTEKLRLVKEGKLKAKDAVSSVIFKGDDNKYYEKTGKDIIDITEDIPFDIPDSWSWCRLGTIFQHNTGKALNRADQKGKILSYITTSNLYWDRFELDNLRQMCFTDDEIIKCTVQKGDLLVCEGGDIGRAAIWPFEEPVRIQNHIHRLRPYSTIATRFFYYTIAHFKDSGQIGGKGIGIQGLSSGALHQLLVPVPPMAEQYRIIEKLDKSLASIMSR